MEDHEGFGRPAAVAGGTSVKQPERDLLPGDPRLMGAAPAEEKKGITGRVKDMIGRHGRKKHKQDATAATGDTEPATKGSVLHKVRAKAGSKVGHHHHGQGSGHGPARLLSMSSSSSSMSSSDEEDIGSVGFALDPTGPAVAGSELGREDFFSAPEGPGADFRDLTLNSGDDANGDEMDQHSERAAEYAKTSNPMNPNYGETLTPSEEDTHGGSRRSLRTETSNSHLTPSEEAYDGSHDHSRPTEMDNSNQTASDDGEPHRSNSEGEAMVGEHHGNLHDGPKGHSVKQDGFVHNIVNEVH